MAAIQAAAPATEFWVQQRISDQLTPILSMQETHTRVIQETKTAQEEHVRVIQETQARLLAVENRTQAIESRSDELFQRAEKQLDDQQRSGQELMDKIASHQNQLAHAETLVNQIGGQSTAHEERMRQIATAISQHETKVGESQRMLEKVV